MADPAVALRVLYVDGFDEGVSPVPDLERDAELDVTVAGTGSDAHDLLGDEFDCVVCGAQLPDESGFEWCRHGKPTDLPVVIVGPEPTGELVERALAAGAVDYMPRSLLSASPRLFGARLRRIVDEVVDPVRASPLDALPIPALLGDERVHYANEAASTALAGGNELVGRRLDDLLEVDEPLTDGDERRARLARTGDEVTFRRVSLPDTGLALTVVFDEAVAAGDDGRLRQRAQMLDSILEHIPLAVYFKDRDGRHVAVSDYLTRMNPNRKIINPEGKVHHTTDDIMGKTDFDLYPSELAEQTVADEQEVVENGEPVINKTEYTYTPDQELMRLSTSKAPWYGPNGEILGVVGITANITDEKRYEDTVDYQQTVIGMMQAVLDEPIAGSIEEVRRIVDELSADAATVSELSATVEEIEDHVAVVETLLREGQQEFGTELVDIEQIARQSWDRVGTDEATMTVTYNGIIRADPNKVGQLFDELFENAVEHGSTSPDSQARQDAVEHGGPEVAVTVEQFEDGFFIADDGPGIPPGDRRNVFEYGYSTDDDALGSGLTIAETIASSLGWELTTVESAGGGCRFEVTGITFE